MSKEQKKINLKNEIKKPEVRLIGEDGNVFNLIGIVSSEMKRAGLVEEAKGMTQKAMQCHSYEEVLALFSEYVEIV